MSEMQFMHWWCQINVPILTICVLHKIYRMTNLSMQTNLLSTL